MADGKRDELDRILDAELAKYAAAAPRTGLEERVLANLRAERTRVPDRARLRWSLAGAPAAVVIVALALAWRSGRPSHPVVENHPSATTPNLEQSRPQAAPKMAENDARPQAPSPATRRATHRVRHEVVAAASPKLDQFPSRHRLSEEELALARYVSEFPQEATQIAQAQEEYEKKIQQMMKDARSETEGYDSDQQER